MRSPSRLLALAAVVAVACADNTFTAPTATPPLVLSMSVHAAPPPVLAWLRAAHVPWVRVTYYYQTVGDSGWAADLTAELAALHANGQQVDLVVHSTPAADPDGVGIPHAVADLLRHNPGAINAVELYNEENVGLDYWRPVLPGATDSARGAAYAPRYTAMRDSVRALYPLLRVPVLTGGTAGDPSGFLRGLRAAGVTPDVIAVHAYGYPPAVQLSQFVAAARALYPGVPVWATEVGSEGGRTDSTTLALDIGGLRAYLATHRDVHAFWYCAWGDPADGILSYTTFLPRPGTSALLQPY